MASFNVPENDAIAAGLRVPLITAKRDDSPLEPEQCSTVSLGEQKDVLWAATEENCAFILSREHEDFIARPRPKCYEIGFEGRGEVWGNFVKEVQIFSRIFP